MNLIDELFGRPKMKGKIIVEVDDDREKAETTIEGTFPTVLTMISLICVVDSEEKAKEVKELLKKLGVED